MILAGALFTLGCDVQAPSKNPVKGGSSASFGVEGIVEYTVQDSVGRVLKHGMVHNTVNSDALATVEQLEIGESILQRQLKGVLTRRGFHPKDRVSSPLHFEPP